MSGKLRAVRVGDRFGRWRVLYQAKDRHYQRRWLCQCDCLTIREVREQMLMSGRSKSCGCLKAELLSARTTIANTLHGEGRKGEESQEYRTWMNMISRCHNPSHPAFGDYGGRGIYVCEEWRENYLAFLAHVGRRPTAQHTIDRINNNRGYEPGNVRWATDFEQGRNKRNNHLITFRGETHPLSVWAEITGKRSNTILNRLSAGLSVGEALTRPVQGKAIR